ncbi:hypothetical protein CEE45_15275 [Candidatus Heimdallarchaeota archaeon B3_Heim]|nr:MAG: hypothetical protein CEE45_15275 [Candidatus Heimdallarchaeota archaeon B3_Heim]
MSEIRGNKGFESPSQEDLDDYLRQSRKSITQMKDGKPPIIFKPKKALPIKFLGIMLLVVVSSSLMLVGSFIDFDSPGNNNNTDKTTTETTTMLTTTTTTTTQVETTIPIDIEKDITTSIPLVEAFINTMIAPNHSLINPIVINGTINRSQTISDLELFDLVWILSQFDENSEWWNLGRSLIFEKYLLWNKTSFLTENLRTQLLALRSMIAYSNDNILLESDALESYQNLTKQLWENVSSAYDNVTGTFNPDNSTILHTNDQILFSQVLAKTAGHPTPFNFNIITEKAILLLNTIYTLTEPTDGLPESFDHNLTRVSDVFYSHHQAAMILVLDKLSSLLGSFSIINTLANRLNNYLTNIFLQQNWSIAFNYNQTSHNLSSKIVLTDQILFIRVNILQNKRNFADYTISTVKSSFGSENSSYFTANDDQETQFLTDHVYLLLSFEEFLKLETTATTYTSTEPEETSAEQPDAAGFAWEFTIILTVLVFISYRRRKIKQ